MKVVVTGGTGFVGREVLRQVHAAGHQLRVLTRNSNSRSARDIDLKYNAEVVGGDILDSESLKTLCTSGDAVIHLVGIISEFENDTFENVHHRGTQNVVEAAGNAGIKRFIHMSALGARELAVSRYHQSKWAGEETVRSSGLDYTIMRPSIIYGRQDAFTNVFARMARFSPFIPVIGPGEGTFQPVFVKSIAQCFANALSEPRSIGKTFDLGGPEILTLNEVLDAILDVIGRRRTKVHLPLPVARVFARMLEKAYPTILRMPAPLNRDQIIMLQEKTIGDLQPAIELLQLHAPPFRDGLRKYL
jgi:uncharacterized protein YbjT (DUF2867 family)